MKVPGRAILAGTMILLITSFAFAKTPEIVWTQERDEWVGRVTWETKVGEKGQLDVREFVGTIEIAGDASKHAVVTMEFRVDRFLDQEEAEELAERHFPELTSQGKRLKVRGRESKSHHGHRDYELYMVANLPKKFNVDARTGAGSIQVRDLEGDISLVSGGGSIEVVSSAGNINVATGGGSILIEQVQGDMDVRTGGGSILIEQVQGDMDVRTGGGNIELFEVVASRRTSVKTGAGSIALSQSEGDYVLRTGAGSIELRGHKGDVEAFSGSGSIDLRHHNGGVTAKTGTGSIDAEIEKKLSGRSEIELGSGFGSIELALPEDFKASVYALVKHPKRNNAIESDYPLTIGMTRGDELVGEGDLNGGGVPVRLEAARSRIRIRKM